MTPTRPNVCTSPPPESSTELDSTSRCFQAPDRSSCGSRSVLQEFPNETKTSWPKGHPRSYLCSPTTISAHTSPKHEPHPHLQNLPNLIPETRTQPQCHTIEGTKKHCPHHQAAKSLV
ncbi:hypothetical protein HanIR_Chr05g0215371 [Helianthus annuus]|nr:hypothetical protein HanIR_Chr05g0215371 [Helianthus annuus]